jgi:hypothetical protein
VGFSRFACGHGTCSRLPGGRRHGLSHSWLFPFAWQTQISSSRGSHPRGLFAVPDLHREVRATEKRLACSEHASLHTRANSLAGCDARERVSVRYNSLRSTRLKPSKLPDISITDVRTQKGRFPSLLCAFDRNGRGSTRLRARFKMPKPPEQTSFPFFGARTSSPVAERLSVSSRAQRVFNWSLSISRIYLMRKIYLCVETFRRFVSHIAWLSSGSFPEIL